MKKKIKIIDLLCLISIGEEVPKKIRYQGTEYVWQDNDYKTYIGADLLSDDCLTRYINAVMLNDEVEILDDEEDKDIPLIPDDELIILKQEKAIDMQKAIDFNFKVLQEKINQVVEEFNEYRKDHE